MSAILSQTQSITANSEWQAHYGIYSAVGLDNTLLLRHPFLTLLSGKRYNVLRDRIDSWDYDIDQLLFGTMLFTLVAFLFPTVLAYYVLFATVSSIAETRITFAN
jgi:phosphatidylinositol glycan class Q protein